MRISYRCHGHDDVFQRDHNKNDKNYFQYMVTKRFYKHSSLCSSTFVDDHISIHTSLLSIATLKFRTFLPIQCFANPGSAQESAPSDSLSMWNL